MIFPQRHGQGHDASHAPATPTSSSALELPTQTGASVVSSIDNVRLFIRNSLVHACGWGGSMVIKHSVKRAVEDLADQLREYDESLEATGSISDLAHSTSAPDLSITPLTEAPDSLSLRLPNWIHWTLISRSVKSMDQLGMLREGRLLATNVQARPQTCVEI